MKMLLAATAAISLCAAQVLAQQATPLVIGGAVPAAPMLRTGTEVPLKTTRELTTEGKKLRVGDRFDLEVSEPVL